MGRELFIDLGAPHRTTRLSTDDSGNLLADGVALPSSSGQAAAIAAAIAAIPSVGGATWLDPAIRGYLAQVHPLEDCTGSGAITAGGPTLSKIWVPQTIVATNILVAVATAIAGSPANCFATLFKSDGTIIGSTNDRSVAWATLAVDSAAIVGGPKTIIGGPGVFIWGSILVGTGTTVQFGRKTIITTTFPNAGLTPATYYSSTNAGGLSALSAPTAFTPASNANNNSGAFWMAVS